MKRLLIIFALLGRLYAGNPCSERNINMSGVASSIALGTGGAAQCTAGTVGGITWTCPNGGMSAWGFDIPNACDSQYLTYAVQAVDSGSGAGHRYDLGLYYIKGPSVATLAGHLMLHTGSLDGTGGSAATSFTPATGLLATAKTWATTTDCPSLPCTLPSGQYGIAITTDCSTSCAALYGDENKGFMPFFYVWLGGDAGSNGAHINPGLRPSGCTPTCSFNYSTVPGLPATITPPTTDPGFFDTGFPRQPAVLIF